MDANNVIGVSIKGNVKTKDFELVKNFINEVEVHYEFLRIYVEIKEYRRIFARNFIEGI